MTIEISSTSKNGNKPTCKSIWSKSPHRISSNSLSTRPALNTCVNDKTFNKQSIGFNKSTTLSSLYSNVNGNLQSSKQAFPENSMQMKLSQPKHMMEPRNVLNINVDGDVEVTLNCTTPYRYHPRHNLSSKSIFLCCPNLRNVNYPVVTCSESSVEEIDGDFKQSVLKRYIKNTVGGWDQKGLHYWLHKMDCSNVRLPSVENLTEGKESLFHLHICEECVSKMDFYNFSENEGFNNPLNLDACLNQNRLLNINNNKCIRIKENDRLYNYGNYTKNNDNVKTHLSDTADLNDNNNNCSDQFFERFVYCYNTCGFEFEFGKMEINTEKQLQYYGVNPFTKIVVYGTDPCGLNFPMEIYKEEYCNFFDPTSSMELTEELSGSNESVRSILANEESQEMFRDQLIKTEYSEIDSNSYEEQSENNWSLPSSSPMLEKPLSQIDSSQEFSATEASSDAFGILYTTSTDDSSETKEMKDNSLTLYNKLPLGSNSSMVIKLGTSYINMHMETARKLRKCSSGNNIMLSNRDKSNKILSRPHIFDHGKNYRLYSLPRKRVKFGQNKALTQKHFPIPSGFEHLKLKKRNGPSHILRCSNSSESKVRMIYLGNDYDRICINEIDNDNIVRSENISIRTAPHKNDNSRNLPLIIMVCSSLLLLLIFNFLLVEDVIRQPTVPAVTNKWYIF